MDRRQARLHTLKVVLENLYDNHGRGFNSLGVLTMILKWKPGEVQIELSTDDAKALLVWLQKIGVMEPLSVPAVLRSRLSEWYARSRQVEEPIPK